MRGFSLILEILTAVGTIDATIVALCLAIRDDKPRINGAFVWSTATKYQPTLSAIKVHRKTETKYSQEMTIFHLLIRLIWALGVIVVHI